MLYIFIADKHSEIIYSVSYLGLDWIERKQVGINSALGRACTDYRSRFLCL